MPSLQDQLRGLVYSTEHGETCPDCRQPVAQCECRDREEAERIAALDGIVRIRRETSGRKGKGVTTIQGVPLGSDELKTLAKTLKKRCGKSKLKKEKKDKGSNNQRAKMVGAAAHAQRTQSTDPVSLLVKPQLG